MFGLVFDEAISGVSAIVLSVTGTGGTATGCVIGTPAGSGTTWSITITGCSTGTIILRLAAGAIADLAGNLGPVLATDATTVTIDRTTPAALMLSAVTAARTDDTDLVFRLAGSEDLDCVTLDAVDLVVTGGTLGTTTSAGSACDIAVASTVASGATGVTSVAASGAFSVADEAGNATTTVTGAPSVTLDRIAPIVSLSALTANPAHGTALVFALTAQAGEALDCATLTSADLVISRGSLAGVTRISDTECEIAVTSSVGAGARGTTSLTAAAGFSVSDMAGNIDTTLDGPPAGVVVDRTFRAGFGDGHDGDVVVTSGQTLYTDAVRSSLAAVAAAGQRTVTVASAAGFAVGQHVLVIQMQGTGAGGYELGVIEGISGTTLRLQQPLAFAYTTGGVSRAQVIVVPRYRDLTVRSGGVVTAHAWDGTTGGVVAFRASGVVDVQLGGAVNADGIGFRGTPAQSSGREEVVLRVGEQGEGTGGPPGTRSTSANGNGGGGGGYDTNGPWNGGRGGGGGGNGTAGAVGGWSGGGNAAGGSAAGGLAIGGTPSTSLVLGGGGGQGGIGDTLNNAATDASGGGRGGGIILVAGEHVNVAGSVRSSGIEGHGSAGARPSTSRRRVAAEPAAVSS